MTKKKQLMGKIVVCLFVCLLATVEGFAVFRGRGGILARPGNDCSYCTHNQKAEGRQEMGPG